MSALKIGSLCSGYGGLDMAVQEVFGGEVAWFFEYDKAPSKILAHHWPHVPNYGDMTKADWAAIEQVDILCGGTPCQDLSGAGKRAGMTEGTRSNLWVQMREAIAIQRPSIVIWENVRGAYSARADSEMERTEGLLGEDRKRPVLRALGRVLGDLSSLGYEYRVVPLRASDVGAPHQRYRIFVIAHLADTDNSRGERAGRARDWWERSENNNLAPRNPDNQGLERRPATVERSSERTTRSDGVGHTATLPDPGSERLREYPRAAPTQETRPLTSDLTDSAGGSQPHSNWGPFEPAVRRWERTIGIAAPPATNADGKGGRHRLAPVFVEWMMGLEPGHVTNPAIGLSRTEQLKALGNGVVPQQAELAIRIGVTA